MTRYVVDTSAYSAFFRGDPRLVSRIQTADFLALTPVVLGELIAGFRNGNQYEKNRTWLAKFLASSRVTILDVDRETAERYSEIQAYLKGKGQPIPTNDIWIAASAMQHGFGVVTTDPHFERVPQLSVEVHTS